jgi:hypothetical protein
MNLNVHELDNYLASRRTEEENRQLDLYIDLPTDKDKEVVVKQSGRGRRGKRWTKRR